MYGRLPRTSVPYIPDKLMPREIDKEKVRERDDMYKEKMAYFYDRKNGAKENQPLIPGEPVRVRTDNMKNWSTTGTITEHVAPRSYNVTTDQGTYRRNANHVMPDKSAMQTSTTPPPEAEATVPTTVVNLSDSTTVKPSDQSSGYTTRSGRAVKPINRLTLEMQCVKD